MKSELEILKEQAYDDYRTARKLIDQHGHLTGASLHAAHKLLENAFARWVKCEKLMRSDTHYIPSDDDMAEYM